MKEQFHVYGIGMNGASYPLPFALEDFGNVLRFSIKKNAGKHKPEHSCCGNGAS